MLRAVGTTNILKLRVVAPGTYSKVERGTMAPLVFDNLVIKRYSVVDLLLSALRIAPVQHESVPGSSDRGYADFAEFTFHALR